jgi:hypothetical protein
MAHGSVVGLDIGAAPAPTTRIIGGLTVTGTAADKRMVAAYIDALSFFTGPAGG